MHKNTTTPKKIKFRPGELVAMRDRPGQDYLVIKSGAKRTRLATRGFAIGRTVTAWTADLVLLG